MAGQRHFAFCKCPARLWRELILQVQAVAPLSGLGGPVAPGPQAACGFGAVRRAA